MSTPPLPVDDSSSADHDPLAGIASPVLSATKVPARSPSPSDVQIDGEEHPEHVNEPVRSHHRGLISVPVPEPVMVSGEDEGLDAAYLSLFTRNKEWVQRVLTMDSTFFARSALGQTPKFLWIGCADSRIPAEVICSLEPGEAFVHRNVANLVISTDLNVQTVIQYAVEALKVEHILVCGHYGCGGVKAAMQGQDAGMLDNWLRNIRDVQRLHAVELRQLEPEARYRRVVELNVAEQVLNVFKTGVVQRARAENFKKTGRRLPRVHGLIYDLSNGMLQEVPVDYRRYARRFADIFALY